MKAQKKMLVLFTCRVAHIFRTSSFSALRPERNALVTECRRRPVSSGGVLHSAPAIPDDVAPVAGRDVAGVTLKIAFDALRGVADLSRDTLKRFTCKESLDMVNRLRRALDAVLICEILRGRWQQNQSLGLNLFLKLGVNRSQVRLVSGTRQRKVMP